MNKGIIMELSNKSKQVLNAKIAHLRDSIRTHQKEMKEEQLELRRLEALMRIDTVNYGREAKQEDSFNIGCTRVIP